nr:hypothetical protein [uncultured Desulfobacter sp.]
MPGQGFQRLFCLGKPLFGRLLEPLGCRIKVLLNNPAFGIALSDAVQGRFIRLLCCQVVPTKSLSPVSLLGREFTQPVLGNVVCCKI